MSAKSLSGDDVKLVRYSIISIRRGRERALLANEHRVVAQSMTGEAFASWMIADYVEQHAAGHPEAKDLRVVYEVLGRWPKPELRYESKQLQRLGEVATAIRRSSRKEGVAGKPAAGKKAAKAVAKKGGNPSPAPERKVLAALTALGGQSAMGELAAETGVSRGTLRRRLGRLIDAGKVRRVGEGLKTRYHVVEE